MRPRAGIIEIFSTFLQFNEDRFKGWATDPKLRRSMQNRTSQLPQPESSENFWVLYWWKVLQTQAGSLAKEHLVAYLQETCYWSAQKTLIGLTSGQYTVADFFQIAIAQINRVLKGFNPNQGFGLKNYASAVFGSTIRETLRQRQEVDITTPWALLRKLSQKRLWESLQLTGLSSETIARYILAWNCFKTIYSPTEATKTRKLSGPDPATWQAIASLYNTQRHVQLHPPGPECNPETLEKWLLSCASAARGYLYPHLTSINTPIPGQESGELLDNLVGNDGSESLLTQIITQEEEQTRLREQAQVNSVLVEAVAQLEPSTQQLLQLYYGQGLTQQQIAKQFEMQQYTVSRRLTKTRESLLLKIARWSQDTMHISLTSDLLKSISIVLEEWLQAYYSNADRP